VEVNLRRILPNSAKPVTPSVEGFTRENLCAHLVLIAILLLKRSCPAIIKVAQKSKAYSYQQSINSMSMPLKESPVAELLRHTFRTYRNLPICPGHPLLRRIFSSLIGRRQRICLRNGIRLEVDLVSVIQHTIFWMDGDMEPQLEWAVREFLPVGGTCVDCGANCGYIGLFAHRMRSARVVFVEPHPVLAAAVRRNVELNGWQKACTVVEAAASDKEGSAQLFESPDYDGEHSLLQDWAGGRKKVRPMNVRVVTLPGVFTEQGIGRVDFLKIDAEGSDFDVLKGLGTQLNPNHIRVLYAELGGNRTDGVRLLQDSGYEGFGYVRGKTGKQLRRHLKRYREDRPIMLYEKLMETRQAYNETLWLPKDGPEAAHMAGLTKLVAGDERRSSFARIMSSSPSAA
jgi:FkbM family methyltransferase